MKAHSILPRHLIPATPALDDGMLAPPDLANYDPDHQLFVVIAKPGRKDTEEVREPPLGVERIPCPVCQGSVLAVFCRVCSPLEVGLRGWVYRFVE